MCTDTQTNVSDSGWLENSPKVKPDLLMTVSLYLFNTETHCAKWSQTPVSPVHTETSLALQRKRVHVGTVWVIVLVTCCESDWKAAVLMPRIKCFSRRAAPRVCLLLKTLKTLRCSRLKVIQKQVSGPAQPNPSAHLFKQEVKKKDFFFISRNLYKQEVFSERSAASCWLLQHVDQ